MNYLIDSISDTKEPCWEVLTWKNRWWQLRKVHMRIVFRFHVKGDSKEYRLDYDPSNEELIFTHTRPKSLLEENGINPNDNNAWLEQLKVVKFFCFEKYSSEIEELLKNVPRIPKWYKRII